MEPLLPHLVQMGLLLLGEGDLVRLRPGDATAGALDVGLQLLEACLLLR